jgi:Flp pilus assembly protein TadB
MARRATLRTSDAEREQVAERLRQAAVEGRILAHELEERLEAVFVSRTYGELDAVVADLPRSGPPRRRRPHDVVSWRAALLLAVVVPFAILVLAVAIFVLTGLLAVWVLSLAIAWWFLGHRLRFPAARRARWHSARAPRWPARS